jgi:hypothetical protein
MPLACSGVAGARPSTYSNRHFSLHCSNARKIDWRYLGASDTVDTLPGE